MFWAWAWGCVAAGSGLEGVGAATRSDMLVVVRCEVGVIAVVRLQGDVVRIVINRMETSRNHPRTFPIGS